MDRYDVAVIGGGAAGLTAAAIAGRVGARVLLIDKQRLGGDCTYHGCIPSKALIKSARVAHQMRDAARFGIAAEEPQVDFQAVHDSVHQAIGAISAHETPEAMAELGIEVAFGGARFLSATRILAGEREIEATHTILCLGSHAKAPPIPGLDEVGFIDHVALFEQTELPRRLAVIGGGPIGMEMGQALARLGAEVTVLQNSDRVLPRDDEELSRLLMQALADELTIFTEASVTRIERGDEGKRVIFERDGAEQALACDEILVAVGRAPSLESLDQAQAGVETNRTGVVVNQHLRTTARNIWAAGDCTGAPQFTHLAQAQATVAARNALFRGSQRFEAGALPWTTFTDPELAQVGLLEADARRQGKAVKVYRHPYDRLDRAICEGETAGLAKVVCTPKGKILGASILGIHSGEAINEFAVAIKNGLSLKQLANAIHVYPTLGRIVRRLGDERFLEEGVAPMTQCLFGKWAGKEGESRC